MTKKYTVLSPSGNRLTIECTKIEEGSEGQHVFFDESGVVLAITPAQSLIFLQEDMVRWHK